MDDARPSQGEQTRARLLAVAAREFARHGYHATKVSAIVAGSGVTQPTFYAYFPSKEALFRDLLDGFRARVRALVGHAPLPPGHTPDEVVRAVQGFLRAVLEALAENPDLTRLAFLHAPDANEVKRELTGLLARNLAAAQAHGALRPDVPADLAAEALSGAVERLALCALLTRQTTPDELARHLAELHFRGLLAAPQEQP